jgi:Holliday junction DNA helicase RuvB
MTATQAVDVTALNDEELAAMHAHFAQKNDAGSLAVVEADILRRAKAQAGGLENLRQWAQGKAQPRQTAPKAPQASPAVPKAPPSIKDRPQAIQEIVGQKNLVGRLQMVCAGATLRGTPMPHCLISGPAGFGKTTLAQIIAKELKAELIVTAGMVLKRSNDLVGLLVKIDGPTILFIDEIHAMAKIAQEQLYTALEDGKIDILGGHGMDTVAYTHELPNLVVVGATTRPGLLTTPLRDRFGFQAVMDDYAAEELAEIVTRAWDRVNVPCEHAEALTVAERCKGVPRRALHLAERVLDYQAVMGTEGITEGLAAAALELFGINEAGLDEADFKILDALTSRFAGKSVGLDALSQALDMDAKTLAEQYEPYLVRMGYMARAKGGRMATAEAYEFMKEQAA